jgi:hypothetical protein
MKWVYPGFLFALAVLLIPLLIHLFHFKRYKTVYFSSLTFLRSVEQNQKNTRKLKYWLIFAARALAFSFLVFAFAQPYFPSDENAAKAAKKIVGVYVDNSFSMTRIGENGELISQARELAKSVVSDAPRTARFVLITNELGGDEKQTLTQAQFLEKIEKLKPSPLVRSSGDVLRWWEQFLSDKSVSAENASSQLVWLSDFQRSTFGKAGTYKNLKTSLFPVALSPVNKGNLYIDSIWFATPVQKQGAKQTIYVRLRNDGGDAISNADVSFRIGSVNRDVFSSLPQNGSDTVELSYYNNETGRIQGAVVVNDKQMNMDDSFFFSYEVRKESKVLIIDGESAVPNVATVYGLDEFYKFSSVNQNNVSAADLRDKDLAVVNGSNNISASLANELYEFAENGGSVVLFPGSNAATSGWNGLLGKLGLPVLGALQTNGLTLRTVNHRDPFFNGVFERKPENLNLPLVKQAYRLQRGSGTQSIDLLSFRNGNSFFVRGTGKFNVYLSAASLDAASGSFTSNQLFSTLLLRIGELSQRQAPYYLVIGEDGSYPVSAEARAEEAVHLKSSSTDFIPTIFTRRENTFLSIQGLEAVRQLQSGNYSIVSAEKQIGSLSINYNREESRTQAMTEDEIMNALLATGLDVESLREAKGWSGASFLQLERAETLWKLCVIFAILFILAEMAIVYFWKR